MPRKRDKGKARKARKVRAASNNETAAVAIRDLGPRSEDGNNNNNNMPNSFAELHAMMPDMPDEIAQSLSEFEKSANLFSDVASGGSSSRKSGKELYNLLNKDDDKKNEKSEKEKALARAFEDALMELELSQEISLVHQKAECSICKNRMPPKTSQSKYLACCGYVICRSCFARVSSDFFRDMLSVANEPGRSVLDNFAPANFEKKKKSIKCPFCRCPDIMTLNKVSQDRYRKLLEQRAEKNEHLALLDLGKLHLTGDNPTPDEIGTSNRWNQDEIKAIECFEKAADLGNCDAYHELSKIQRKLYKADEYLAYLEKAAKLGCMEAHEELAKLATKQGNINVAMSHYKVLAFIGYDQNSIDQLTIGYKAGHVSKDDLASALRSFQASRKEFVTTDRTHLARLGSSVSSDGKLVPSDMY